MTGLAESPGPPRDLIGYGRAGSQSVLAGRGAGRGEPRSELRGRIRILVPAGDGRNAGFPELVYPMDPDYRDLASESMYEYGSRAGIWRLARLLDEFQLKCTFFGCAVAFEENPDVGRYIQEAGHEPCCHGWRWEQPYTLSREQEKTQLDAAVASIARTCGERPRGWYSFTPASLHTRELLVEEGGFVYDSDAFNDDLPYFVEVKGSRHLVVPYSLVYNDARFLAGQAIQIRPRSSTTASERSTTSGGREKRIHG